MKKFVVSISMFAPAIALAQTALPVTDVNSLTAKLVSIGNLVIFGLISLAVIFIIWNVVMTLVKGDSPDEKSGHLKNVGWGVVGLAIILSIWGLVAILTNTFRTVPPTNNIPQVNLGSIPFVR